MKNIPMKRILSNYAFSLLVCLLFCRCNNDKGSGLDELNKMFAQKETLHLEAKPSLIRSEDLGDHGYLACIDSLLLIGNYRGDHLITVYNLHTGAIVNRLAPRGKAKNEFLQIGNIQGLNDRVMVYGRMPPHIAWIPKEELLDSFPKMEHIDIVFEYGGYLSVFPIFGDKYVATGRFDLPESKNHQFALIEPDGTYAYTFEDYLLHESIKSLPNYNLAFGYQGTITPTPNGKHGFYGGWNNAVWKFYDFSGERPHKIKEYPLILPSFTPQKGGKYGVVHSESSIGGTIFAAASNDRYYVLFSDKPYGTYSTYYTDRIYVFDLQGNPLQKIKLDRELIAIAYWAEKNALLGCAVSEEGEPQILQIDL